MTSYLKSTPHPTYNSFHPEICSKSINSNPKPTTIRNDNTNQLIKPHPVVKPDVYSVLEKASKYLNKKNVNIHQRVSTTRMKMDLSPSIHSSTSSISIAESEMPSDLSSSWEGSMIVTKNRQRSRSSRTKLNETALPDKESCKFMLAATQETRKSLLYKLNGTNEAANVNPQNSEVSGCKSAHSVPLSSSGLIDKSTLNKTHVPASEPTHPSINVGLLQISAQQLSTSLVELPACSSPSNDSSSMPCSLLSSVQESVYSIHTEPLSATSSNTPASTNQKSNQANSTDTESVGSKENAYEEDGFEEYAEGDTTSIMASSFLYDNEVDEHSCIPDSSISAQIHSNSKQFIDIGIVPDSSHRFNEQNLLTPAVLPIPKTELNPSNHERLLTQHKVQPKHTSKTITQSTSTSQLTYYSTKESTACKSTQTPIQIKHTLGVGDDEISHVVPGLLTHQNEFIVRQWIQDAISIALASKTNLPRSQHDHLIHQSVNELVPSNKTNACAICHHPISSNQPNSTSPPKSSHGNVNAEMDSIKHDLIQFKSVPCHLTTTHPKRGLITLEKTLHDLDQNRPVPMSFADAVKLVLKEDEQAINEPPLMPPSRWFQTHHCAQIRRHHLQYTPIRQQFVDTSEHKYRPVDIWLNRK